MAGNQSGVDLNGALAQQRAGEPRTPFRRVTVGRTPAAPGSEVTGHSPGQPVCVRRIQSPIDTFVHDVHLGLSREIDPQLVTDLPGSPLLNAGSSCACGDFFS